MYIEEVRLYNFRSYRDASVRLSPGINVVVGPNNAGKSNLLAGLNLLFGERYPRRADVAQRDFYRHAGGDSPTTLLGVAARLVGAKKDEVRPGADWGAYAEEWSPDPATGEILEPWTDSWWDALINPKRRGDWWGGEELGARLGQAAAEGELWMFVVCEREEGGEFAHGLLLREDDKWFRLLRLRGAVREGLITAAYLPAFRSPEESLRVTEWNWCGRLIRDLYRSGREPKEEEFKKAEEMLSALVREVLTEPSQRVERILSEVVSKLKAQFEAGPFTADEAYKTVTLFLDDGVYSPYWEKGAGLQSLLVIALFTLYCERFHESGTLLLLEEPENHLHPHARRAMVSAMREFVRGNETRRQVIVTTHSENLVPAADVEGLSVVRRKADGSRFWKLPRDHMHKPRWQQILRRSPEVVFAEHVILVEGGEEHLVPVVARKLRGEEGDLDRRNVSTVRVEGKLDFGKHVTLLEELGIGWTVLTDRDFLEQGVEQFKDRLPGEALGERKEALVGELERIGVVVNVSGSLEDLYTERGEELARKLGKDRAALQVAQNLEEGASLEDWFREVGPIEKAIDRALKEVSGGCC